MNSNAARERLIARHTSKISKAFKEGLNAETIAKSWEDSHFSPETITTSMGREWARINIYAYTKPMRSAISSIYANGYILGEKIADERLAIIGKAVKKQPVVKPVAINWSTWKPGLPSAAALVRPRGGLKRLLDYQAVKISNEVVRTKIDRIGTALATALEGGFSAGKTAKLINAVINDPEAAMVIARTETARAVSVASRDRYEKNGVEMVSWLASDACDTCEENAGVSPIRIDEEFPSGDTEPPAHPNCECDLDAYFGDDLEDLLEEEE